MKVVLTLLVFTLVTSASLASGQELSQRDKLRSAVQEICPMSGNKLGEHGQPLKVKIGQEELFLCCKGCLQNKVNQQHWATIHANFAKAQAICPVMENPIPEEAAWTIVEGQIVYVCCPPCTEKIEADPETYLRKVDEFYATALKSKKTVR